MLFKKNELRLLWPFYLNQLIYGLSTMIFPFLIVYFKNLGFSYFQISIITSVYGFSMFLFEIPTGAFADGFSRKYSVVLGFFIVSISVSCIPFLYNFYLIICFWILTGMGMTFISGAQEAWVIDKLNKEIRNDLRQEYFIKSSCCISFGAIFAPIIGSILVKGYSVKILWFGFGLGFFLNAIFTLLFSKEQFESRQLKPAALVKKSFHKSKIGLFFSLRYKAIFLFIIAGLFTQFMFMGSIGMQPFLLNLGMKEHQLGYVYSGAATIGIVMSFLSRLFGNHKPQLVMSVVILINVLLLFSLIFISPPFYLVAALILIMNSGVYSFGAPLIQTYFHKFIPERIRATVLSTKSMLDQLAIALSSLIAGAGMDLFGPQKVLAFGGLFGIIALVAYKKIRD